MTAVRTLRLYATLPVTRVEAFGMVVFDPVKAMVGGTLQELLADILEGPITVRTLPSGARVDVMPLCIPDDSGVSFPVNLLSGDLGFANEAGHLVITVPNTVAGHVADALDDDLRANRAVGPRVYRSRSGGLNADFGIAVFPGMRKAFDLGRLGELGVEGR